ncbi:30S ribosomal protein S9 [Candidatus Kaiserbacteria bacterium RIFCSPHIGHO2_02_FULL_49_11]|uniref:Small ribosomal subunit protein uS9 n=1 Tax=Candidatus Kaiserbacteria bacterium RIFCSPHIGHO2_02_FULL_49_11 TaxID=1798489 RepID=A0A1F6CZ32_9BACT|nr:MAG: 30S ribosomal protein S9 [Candidatus Kaiserbacteria bacterium RIFCSPHIGHO2_02_FULL_49_11]
MAETKNERYIETIGRRKTATARVRLTKASRASFMINDAEFERYFPTKELQKVVRDAYALFPDSNDTFKVTARIKGGGIHAQAEALRHGIARALVEHDLALRKDLKKAGFLKRDPRAKERRKFGLKKARRAPQWSKR